MKPQRLMLMSLILVISGACGGDDDEAGEELVSTSVSGSADGTSFSGVYGVSTVLESGTVSTVVGDGPINCTHTRSPGLPPSGIYVNIQIPEATVGVAAEHVFSFSIIEGGNVNGGGSAQGTVEVLAVSEDTITLDVSYSDTIDESLYELSGTFEALRCQF